MLAFKTFVTLALVGLTCALPVDKNLATGANGDTDPLNTNGSLAMANTEQLVGDYMDVSKLSANTVASLLHSSPQDFTSRPPPSRRQAEKAESALLSRRRLIDVNIAMNIRSDETVLRERKIGLLNAVQNIVEIGAGGNINNSNAAKSDSSITIVRSAGPSNDNNIAVASVLAANLARADPASLDRRANGILQEANASGGNDPLTGDPIKTSTQTSVDASGPQSAVTHLVDFLASKETTKRDTVAEGMNVVAAIAGDPPILQSTGSDLHSRQILNDATGSIGATAGHSNNAALDALSGFSGSLLPSPALGPATGGEGQGINHSDSGLLQIVTAGQDSSLINIPILSNDGTFGDDPFFDRSIEVSAGSS